MIGKELIEKIKELGEERELIFWNDYCGELTEVDNVYCDDDDIMVEISN